VPGAGQGDVAQPELLVGLVALGVLGEGGERGLVSLRPEGGQVAGVTAQRVSVRRYQSAQSALMTDPKQEHGYGALQADRTYSVDAEDGVALYVEEVGPVTAPITVIFSHGWTLRSGAWHYQRLGLAG